MMMLFSFVVVIIFVCAVHVVALLVAVAAPVATFKVSIELKGGNQYASILSQCVV